MGIPIWWGCDRAKESHQIPGGPGAGVCAPGSCLGLPVVVGLLPQPCLPRLSSQAVKRRCSWGAVSRGTPQSRSFCRSCRVAQADGRRHSTDKCKTCADLGLGACAVRSARPVWSPGDTATPSSFTELGLRSAGSRPSRARRQQSGTFP